MRSHANLEGKKTIQAVLVDSHPISIWLIVFSLIFLTGDFQSDGARAGGIAITAIGILAAEFIIRMSMLMMLVLKLCRQKTISRHLAHEFSNVSKVRWSYIRFRPSGSRGSKLRAGSSLVHHHQICHRGRTFRAAHRHLRTNGENTTAVRSAVSSTSASIHFMLLQVTVQVGLLAETALAQRAPKQPHHINQSTTSINSM